MPARPCRAAGAQIAADAVCVGLGRAGFVVVAAAACQCEGERENGEPAFVVPSSHPLFSWSAPENEESAAIYVANAPQTTPEGRFYDENIVDLDVFTRDEPTWSPTRAMFAGSYSWIVGTTDRNTFDSYNSAPSPFSIGAQVRISSGRVRRQSWVYSPDTLDFTVRWSTNIRNVVVEARIFRGARQVGRVRESNQTLISLDPDTTYLTWRRPRKVKTGSRLRVLVSVRGGGRAATRTPRRSSALSPHRKWVQRPAANRTLSRL